MRKGEFLSSIDHYSLMRSIDVPPNVYWHKRGTFMVSHEIADYFGYAHKVVTDHIEEAPIYIGEPFSPLWKLPRTRNRYCYAMDAVGLTVLFGLRAYHGPRHDPTDRIVRAIEAFHSQSYQPPAPMSPDGPTFLWRGR